MLNNNNQAAATDVILDWLVACRETVLVGKIKALLAGIVNTPGDFAFVCPFIANLQTGVNTVTMKTICQTYFAASPDMLAKITAADTVVFGGSYFSSAAKGLVYINTFSSTFNSSDSASVITTFRQDAIGDRMTGAANSIINYSGYLLVFKVT
jgi:hypothetical protein